jgi:large subunit ribosomal protein L10
MLRAPTEDAERVSGIPVPAVRPAPHVCGGVFSFKKEARNEMPTAKKEETIEELRRRIADAKHLVFTNYAGLTVEEISKLRGELRKDGATYAVVKNTLFARAAGDELGKQFEKFLAGPTAVLFAGEDPVAPAKALKSFSDETKPVEVKAGFIDGKVVDAKTVEMLASLPSKTELKAMVLGALAAPLRGFAGVLGANRSGFVRILNARQKQLTEPGS